MNIKQLSKRIEANITSQINNNNISRLYVRSSPGIGKTSSLRTLCEQKGWGLIVRNISNMPLEVMSGLPTNQTDEQGVGVFTKPKILATNHLDYTPPNFIEGVTPIVFLLDDLHLANSSVASYLFQLLCDGKIGDFSIDKNVALIAAGNRLCDKSGAKPMMAAISNRVNFVELNVDTEQWITDYAVPNNVRYDIISFLKNCSELICSTPLENTAWASPRSWSCLSLSLDTNEELGYNDDVEIVNDIILGSVGSTVGAKFIEYRELFLKYDFEKIFQENSFNIKKVVKDIEKNPMQAYACSASLGIWLMSTYKASKYNKKTLDSIIKFASKILVDINEATIGSNISSITPTLIAGISFLFSINREDKHTEDIVAGLIQECNGTKFFDTLFEMFSTY